MTLLLLAFGAVASVPGCVVSTQTCTEVGCEDTIVVQYTHAVSGSYSLALQTSGLAPSSISCPTERAPLPAASGVFVSCDGNGFTVYPHGGLGSSPQGAPSIPLTATTTQADAGPMNSASFSVPLTQTLQPNGAACAPTCYDYSATVTLGT
jgi:hypothetical protein